MNVNQYWTQEMVEKYLKKLDEYNSKEEEKIDMHNHTKGSDGDDSPLMLLLRAYRMGLKTIAITDHDTIRGYSLLKEQIEKLIEYYEEINSREDISGTEKEKRIKGAKRLLKVIEEVKIVTGYEVKTIFEGCPYVEILAYGVDIDVLDEKLKQARKGLKDPSQKLYEGLKEIAKRNGIKADLFFMENRSDYRKLFFHELLKHPENAFLYETIEGDTEEEKAENLELDNPESDFYVDLNNSKTRKAEIQKMVKRHKELVFDTDILKNAGFVVAQFYTELLKHPENKLLMGNLMDSQKKLIYSGIYNKNSSFFVDLSTTKPSLDTVINAIHEAGGKALVAHWGRYLSSNEDVFNWKTEQGKKNLEEIIDMCDGAECAYPDNPIELQRLIYNLCKKNENKKFISIGGDNHGKSGKEGKQYMLGSQKGRGVNELEWVKESVIDGKDFLSQIEAQHHYKKRLRELIAKKAEIKGQHHINDEKEK